MQNGSRIKILILRLTGKRNITNSTIQTAGVKDLSPFFPINVSKKCLSSVRKYFCKVYRLSRANAITLFWHSKAIGDYDARAKVDNCTEEAGYSRWQNKDTNLSRCVV